MFKNVMFGCVYTSIVNYRLVCSIIANYGKRSKIIISIISFDQIWQNMSDMAKYGTLCQVWTIMT